MNLKPNWVLQIDPSVPKGLKRIPQKDKERILQIIKSLGEDPYFGDIQKISGEENVWRRRIGSYRIFYEIYPREKSVYVFHIERRTTTTY